MKYWLLALAFLIAPLAHAAVPFDYNTGALSTWGNNFPVSVSNAGNLVWAQIWAGGTIASNLGGRWTILDGGGNPTSCVSPIYTDMHAQLGLPLLSSPTAYGEYQVISIPFTGSCAVSSGFSAHYDDGGTGYWNSTLAVGGNGAALFASWDTLPDPSFGFGGAAIDDTTRFIDTFPTGNVAATTTSASAGADVWVNFNDYEQKTAPWIFELSITPLSFLGTTGRCTLAAPCSWTLGANDFNLLNFSTTTDLSQTGTYLLTAKIRQAAWWSAITDFFGWNPDTIIATSTTFSVVSSSTLPSIPSLNPFIASSTATVSDCLTLQLDLCMEYLFIPDASSLTAYGTLASTIASKPPFGYWTAIQAVLANATTTATSTLALSFTPAWPAFSTTAITDMLAPLRTGLVVILYLALAFWIFHRIRKFDFQA